jgi:starvation-inducible DNA-binding protein
MHPTKIDIPEPARKNLCELLNTHLAHAIDLHLQFKQAHWNVRGPNFIALHELFDEIAEEIEGHIDEIAERVTALGGIAEGISQVVAKKTGLAVYPLNISTGKDHLEALSTAVATFGKAVRAAIDQATEWKDADTADLFTGVSRDLDKRLWFLEAHLD